MRGLDRKDQAVLLQLLLVERPTEHKVHTYTESALQEKHLV
jgi:hypothetical protein